jgi:AraC-like DNA-binding protein/mannose-6-phosphate isomerase-like protein (cupin superfamily)
MCHPCAAPRDVHQSNSGTISGCANLKFDGAKVMAIHCCPLGLTGSLDTANGWQYSRPLGSRAVELGTVRGFDVGLPIHFHDEDQITFVLSGSRRFIIGNELVKVGPGEGTYIPAGVPHRSLAEDSELFCVNVYTTPGGCGARDLISSLVRLRRRQGFLNRADLMMIVEQHRQNTAQSSSQVRAESSRLEPWRTVSEAAHVCSMSREGFSRRFRKLHGMPPQAFQLIEKLNDARRALRSGDSIADVAAQTGFSDQSHLGRLFRRAFGVTPGQYRTR